LFSFSFLSNNQFTFNLLIPIYFLFFVDGNCRTPIAGQAKIVNGKIEFRGIISKPDGSDMIRVSRSGSVADAEKIGHDAGAEIKTIAGPKFKEYGDAVIAQQQAAAAEKAKAASA